MLVGRERERRLIGELIAGARLSSTGILVVTGEPGIGKTALLADAVTRMAGMQVLRATGIESERELPFAGLGQLIRPAADDLAALPGPQAEAIGVALALRTGPPADRFAVGAGVLSLLTRWSEEGPVALLVDDAHLIDRPSAEALTFAARRLLVDPVLMLVGVRTAEPTVFVNAGLPTLELSGLDSPAVRELAEACAGHRLTTRAVADLADATAGNPLAVRELAGDPANLGEIAAAPPGSPVPLGGALADRYTRRVAGLDPRTRTALLVAAAAGDDPAVLARACATLGTGLPALVAAEGAGLVSVSWEGVRFTHPLVRSAAYRAADAGQRRAAHLAIVDALPPGDLDRRAWHRSEATVAPVDDVATDMAAVGDRATSRGAHAVAASAFERAAHLSPDPADRTGRLLRAAAAAWRAGEPDRATRLLDRLEPDATPLVAARALALRGTIAARSGDLADGRDALVAAARAVEPFDVDEAIRLRGEAVLADFYLADAADGRRNSTEIRRLLAGGVTDWARALGSISVGIAQVMSGEPGGTSIRAGIGALAGDVTARTQVPATWRTFGALWLRESTTGRELLTAAVEDRRALADLGELPSILFYRAVDDAATGRWPNAAADYAESITLAREFDQTTMLAMSLAGLARLQARSGQVALCRATAAEAGRISADRTITMGRVWAGLAIADLELASGRVEAAAAEYARVDGWMDDHGIADVDLASGPDRVEALARAGDDAAARRVAADYLVRADGKGQPWALARAHRARGLVAADDELDRWFPAALDWHRQTPDPFETARTELCFGNRLRRARRRVQARPHLQAALDTFEKVGARDWARQAADELDATGATARRSQGRDIDLLTPRELQIALRLADGRTTRQTAAALFLSPKTVEYHLRHVYAKLGIDSRSQLVERLNAADTAGDRDRDRRGG